MPKETMEQVVVWKVLSQKIGEGISLEDLYGIIDLGVELNLALTKCYLVTNRRGRNLEVQVRAGPHKYRGLALD